MIIGEDFKWNKIMKRILILDFDGTIIDSNYVKENSIIEYIKDNYGINIFNLIDIFKFQSLTRYELINLAKKSPISLKEKKDIDLIINSKVTKARLDPFLLNLYKYCSKLKIKIYLVSNTPSESLKMIIDKLKISHYFYKVIGKKANLSKSNIFSQILKDENVKPFNVLSVGDNIQDYFASKINSIPFHGIYSNSLKEISNSIPTSFSLVGIISSLY